MKRFKKTTTRRIALILVFVLLFTPLVDVSRAAGFDSGDIIFNLHQNGSPGMPADFNVNDLTITLTKKDDPTATPLVGTYSSGSISLDFLNLPEGTYVVHFSSDRYITEGGSIGGNTYLDIDEATPIEMTVGAYDIIETYINLSEDALFPYTVEYYRGSETTPFATDTTQTVNQANPLVTLADIDTGNKPAGYKLDHYEFAGNTNATGTVTISAVDNIIKVYYTVDDSQTIPYVINVYKDGVFSTSTTGTLPVSAPVLSAVNTVAPAGYKLESVYQNDTLLTAPYEDIPISLDKNTIIVNYVTDDTQTYSYKVEYYKDGASGVGGTKTGEETVTVLIANPVINSVDTNLHKPSGYVYEGTRVGGTAITYPYTISGNNTVIRVDYVVDNADLLGYSVNYYLDGTIIASTPLTVERANPTIASVNTDNMPAGYKIDGTTSTALPYVVTETNNVIDVKYVADTTAVFTYDILYYKDGVEETALAEIGKTLWQGDPVVEEGDVKSAPVGYKIDMSQTGATQLPHTLTADGEVIHVYYVKDADQNRVYTVNYYKNGTQYDALAGSVGADNPTVNIDVTPPAGYKMDMATTADAQDGTITVTGNGQVFNVYFVSDETVRDTNYTVNYYLDGTTDPVPGLTGGTASGTGYIGEVIAITHPAVTGYKVTSTSPTSLTVREDGTATATVYYVPTSLGYTVEYYVDGVQETTWTESLNVSTGTPNVSSVPDKTPTGYRVDGTTSTALPYNVTATNNVIKVYYVPGTDIGNVTVQHVSTTGATLSGAQYLSGNVGENYTTEAKTINGYTLKETPANSTGTYTVEPIIVTYVYQADSATVTGSVVAKYILEGTTTELSARVETSGTVGTEYTTTAKTITGYTLKATPTNATGNYAEGITTVTYEYTKNVDTPTYGDGIVVVKHVDQSGNEIALRTESSGTFGEAYTTSAKTIPGYTAGTAPANATGTYSEGVITVTYTYTKTTDTPPTIEGSVVVKHVEKGTTTEIFGRDTLTGSVGNIYAATPKTIVGYGTGTLKTGSAPATGTYSEGIQIVTYEYEKTTDPSTVTGNVVAKYILEGTTTELSSRVETGGTVGTAYTTAAKIITGYTLKTTPANATGNYTEGITTVTYEYTKNVDTPTYGDGIVIVKYVDQSGNEIALRTESSGAFGEDYTTTAKTIPGYTAGTAPANATGTYSEGVITVTYTYTKTTDTPPTIEGSVVVKHVEKGTTTEIFGRDTLTGSVDSEYTTAAKTITGYGAGSLKTGSAPATGTYSEGITIVTYEYEKTTDPSTVTGNVVAKYVLDGTTTELSARVETSGTVGTEYTTTAKTITGYTLKATPANVTGNYAEGITTVTYEYTKNVDAPTYSDGIVVVKYVDQSGNEIALRTESSGAFGEDYTTSAKTIPGYTVGTAPANATGTYSEGVITVTYTYTKTTDTPPTIEGSVVVKHVEKGTTTEIFGRDTLTGSVDSEYTTAAKTITGYGTGTLKTGSAPATGTYSEGITIVTYEYEKATDPSTVTGNVVAKYILEGTTTELSSRVETSGTVGTEYTTSAKTITGYTLKATPTNATGNYAEGITTVTYEYTKNVDTPTYGDGIVIVKYVDQSGNEIALRTESSGAFGEDYTTTAKTIAGYTAGTDPANATGTYSEGVITVTYTYTKITDTPPTIEGSVVVKHVERGTTTEIFGRDTLTGSVGNIYAATPKTIVGYGTGTLKTGSAPATGTYSEGIQIVTYEYEKTTDPSTVTGNVVAKYVLEGTTTELSARVEASGTVGTEYTTSAKTITGYTLKATPTNATGNYAEGITTVTYEYTKNVDTPTYSEGIVVVKYVDQSGNEIALRTESSGAFGEDYTTTAKTIAGYTAGTAPANATGTYSEGVITVTYTYTKTTDTPPTIEGSVVVKHLEKGTTTEIFGRDTLTGSVDSEYTTAAKTITGYGTGTLKMGSAPATGTYSEGIQIVTYEYEKTTDPSTITGNVVVKHVLEGTTTELSSRVETSGTVGTEYTTSAKTITGYTLKATPTNATGNYAEGITTVTYEYTKNVDTPTYGDGIVVVKYVDGNGTEIALRTESSGTFGEDYTTSAKTIPGYTAGTAPANATGTYSEGVITVTYTYTKTTDTPPTIEGSVVVKHVEKGTTTEIFGRDTLTGSVGNIYAATPKTIVGYGTGTLKTGSAPATGTYSEGITTVVYEYEKTTDPSTVTGNVVAKYVLDGTTTELSARVETTGTVGTAYTTTAKTIMGYTLKATPTNVTGNYAEGITTVTYEYTKTADTPTYGDGIVVVKYVDGNGTEIALRTESSGAFGENYTTSAKTIPGYTVGTAPANATGTYSEGVITVTYTYTKTTDTPPTIEGSVVVKHLEKGTTTEIFGRDTLTGNVDSEYTTAAKTITGYGTGTLKTGSAPATGTYSEGITVVTYEYEKTTDPSTVIGSVITKHVDAETNSEISSRVTTMGEVGTPYSTEPKTLSGYGEGTLRTGSAPAAGNYTEGTLTVVYEYRKTGTAVGTVTVKHLKEDRTPLTSEEILTGTVGTTYTTGAKIFQGYELTQTPGNATGSFGSDPIIVEYIYKESDPVVTTGSVIVTYQTEQGIDLVQAVTMSGERGTNYTTQPKTFQGYELIETPANATGTFGADPISVAYVYRVAQPVNTDGAVMVEYRDENGEDLGSKALSGEIGSDYKVTPPLIPGYTYKGLATGSAPLEGKFAQEGITVILEFTKDPAATPPAAPVVDKPVDETTTTITGTGTPGNTITVTDENGKEIGSGLVNDEGNFTVTIPPQEAGTILGVTQTDPNTELTSEPALVPVMEKKPAANQLPVIHAENKTILKDEVFDPMEGVTATDPEDGNLPADSIEIIVNNVDPKTPGVYDVVYKVTDKDGGVTVKGIKVTVEGTPNQPPVLTVKDGAINQGEAFDPMEVLSPEARDPEDGNLTGDIVVYQNNVDPTTPGKYSVVFQVADREGLETFAIATVTVRPVATNNKPIIEGAVNRVIHAGGTFDPIAGVTATDLEDGDLTDKIQVDSNVNLQADGNYTVVYSVTDSDGATTYKLITVTVRGNTPSTPPVKPPTDPTTPTNPVDRIYGDSRFDTAIEVSKRSYDRAETVILVNSHRYPDVLTSTVLADVLEAPILLTYTDEVPESTMEEIRRLGAYRIYLIGEHLVISDEIERKLEQNYAVERLGGQTRYDTAERVAEKVMSITGDRDTIVVARGDDFPDALTVGALAVKKDAPILLTPPREMKASTRSLIEKTKPEAIFIAGGTLAVSREVENTLKTLGDVTRLGGANRYDTATVIADYTYPSATTSFIASGVQFIDALSVGPLTDDYKAPILLTKPDVLPEDTLEYLRTGGNEIQRFILVGGPLAISRGVEATLNSLR